MIEHLYTLWRFPKFDKILGEYPTLLECTEAMDWFLNEHGIQSMCYFTVMG